MVDFLRYRRDDMVSHMNYPDGTEIKLDDRVRLLNGEKGTIVFSIDSNEYSVDFAQEDWAYLKEGVMVRTDQGALVHLKNPNNDDVVRL